MMNLYPVAPERPRRITSGERASGPNARPTRIARIGSGERSAVVNASRSVVPDPPRRRSRSTTSTRSRA